MGFWGRHVSADETHLKLQLNLFSIIFRSRLLMENLKNVKYKAIHCYGRVVFQPALQHNEHFILQCYKIPSPCSISLLQDRNSCWGLWQLCLVKIAEVSLLSVTSFLHLKQMEDFFQEAAGRIVESGVTRAYNWVIPSTIMVM